MKLAVTLGLAGACLAVPGCMEECSAVGQMPGLTVELAVANGAPLPGGHYKITVRADAKMLEIVDDFGFVTAHSETPDLVVDGKHLYATGAIGPTGGLVTVGYREGGGPAQVRIDVTYAADLELAGMVATPTYATHYVDSPSCGGGTLTASASLTVPAPPTL